jgi:hypothetical protein
MLLTIKKEVEETVEVKTPCWLVSSYGMYAHITETGDLIQVCKGYISLMDANDPSTQRKIAEVSQKYNSCSEMQFKEALDKELCKLEETYTS